MSKPKLILIGGGGHCKSCIDVIEQEAKYCIAGILDIPERKGEKILGYEVIGNDGDYEKYHREGCEFLITIGQIKTASVRKKIAENLIKMNAKIAIVISPKAYVSKHATVGKGTIIMHHAFVNAEAKIGEHCILNSACNIEHDAIIGNYTHVSTGAFINGDCHVGNEVFVGSNATVSSQVNIGNNIVVGAGSVVIKHVIDGTTVIGVPAKRSLKNS